MIKPVHPVESLPLQRLDRLPGPLLANDFGLVEAISRPLDCAAVAGAADRGLDARLQERLAVADGDVLRAPVALVYQPPWSGLRAWNACSRASSTKSVFMLRLTLQPTMNRENTSTIKATYVKPFQVETKVKSAIQSWLGRCAVKLRLTRSSGSEAAGSG